MTAFLAFLFSRNGLIVVACAAGLAAFVWYTSSVYEAGANDVITEDFKATIETQGKIDDAQKRAPRTPDAVDRSLRDGTF